MSETDDALRTRATEYLRLELAPQERFELRELARYTASPLWGPGDYAIFSFPCTGQVGETFFVLTGDKGATNYYPDWGLPPPELRSVHLGMEFYLSNGVQTEGELEPSEQLQQQASALAEGAFAGVTAVEYCEAYRLPAAGEYPAELHAVYRCTHGSGTGWVVVGECPHQVIDKDVPAHVAWRLHMGRLIEAG